MIQNTQFRDRANGVSVGGKGIISKAPTKAGRKPLGEISNSNSLKPPQNHISKKQQNRIDFTCPRDEKGDPKSTNSFDLKQNLSKSVKNATTGSRKPLGDISNSRKPALHKISEKITAKNANLLELGDPGIGDKGFLHHHAECIKIQRKAVDMDYFLETIGLRKDSSLNMSNCLLSTTEEDLEHNELSDSLYEESSPVQNKSELQTKLNWSPPCKTPKSYSFYMQWGNGDALEFGLEGTPTALEN
uniref:Uncharacterized protein n=1 Tax=Kalanchoe fedtschenkoi TaxID=63787 RepID=A0A7N0US41_KALFE